MCPDFTLLGKMEKYKSHLSFFFRRWVRLLFGREFPLQDLLVVWDALFADSITLNLVDYIFVAMLLYIRDACKYQLSYDLLKRMQTYFSKKKRT